MIKYRFNFLPAAILLLLASGASCAEVKVACTAVLKSSMVQLTPAFEKATGNKLAVTYGSTDLLKSRIEKGMSFDLSILSVAATDALVRKGRLDPASRQSIGRSEAGVVVRKGAPKPDLRTTEAFKQALLGAKSIAYSKRGLVGIYMKTLLKRLGIQEQVAGKIKFKHGARAVASGDAELGIAQISEIIPVAGAELAGPFPKEIELVTEFHAAVASHTAQSSAAGALIKFLISSQSRQVLKANGLTVAD